MWNPGTRLGSLTVLAAHPMPPEGNARQRRYAVSCDCGWEGDLDRQQVAEWKACPPCRREQIRAKRAAGPKFPAPGTPGHRLYELIVRSRIIAVRGEDNIGRIVEEALEAVRMAERSGDWDEAFSWYDGTGARAETRNVSVTKLCEVYGG